MAINYKLITLCSVVVLAGCQQLVELPNTLNSALGFDAYQSDGTCKIVVNPHSKRFYELKYTNDRGGQFLRFTQSKGSGSDFVYRYRGQFIFRFNYDFDQKVSYIQTEDNQKIDCVIDLK